ncbi:MAG: methyltransferase domain-containing protein [Anaerolineales bacterium]|nr:methyltransferase domain-containing protein [Anaerolineales bacterium]
MKIAQFLYNFGYRHIKMPWDIGPRKELVDLVENGRIQPCRAIDLGSGTASNCIFLAQHGFDVTGVDYAPAAIDKGRAMAREAGVEVEFIVDDLTDLQHVQGTFDLLVDYGTLDDLSQSDRDLYVQNVWQLTHPGSQFLLYGFEWSPRWWEKPFHARMAFKPGEVEQRFSDRFEIERIAGTEEPDFSSFPPGTSVYLMRRNGI